MRIAGVRELKAKLSAYLRDVQRGEVVQVTDRGRVVAELRKPAGPAADPDELRYRALVERGLLRPGDPAMRDALKRWPDPGLPAGSTQAWIDDMRRDAGE